MIAQSNTFVVSNIDNLIQLNQLDLTKKINDSNILVEWLSASYLKVTILKNSHCKLQMDIHLAEDISIDYVIEDHATLELYEFKYGQEKSGLETQVYLGENSNIQLMSVNHHEHLMMSHLCYAKKDSYANLSYTELSKGKVDAAFRIDLVGERAKGRLSLAAISANEDHKKCTVMLNHLAKMTEGHMFNYGVSKDKGHLEFVGIGRIVKGMIQSKTHQTSKIMVFDPESEGKINPYLYIDENDVEASHAAGLGRMDQEHLFYLQSRGLTLSDAKKLITHGYLEPVLVSTDDEVLKTQVHDWLSMRLSEVK